jgi:hypothetical protein
MIVIAVLHAAAVAYLMARAVAIPSWLRQAREAAYRAFVHHFKNAVWSLWTDLARDRGLNLRNDRFYLFDRGADACLVFARWDAFASTLPEGLFHAIDEDTCFRRCRRNAEFVGTCL